MDFAISHRTLKGSPVRKRSFDKMSDLEKYHELIAAGIWLLLLLELRMLIVMLLKSELMRFQKIQKQKL